MLEYEQKFEKGIKRKQTKEYVKAANDYQIAKRKLNKKWATLTDEQKLTEKQTVKELKNIMLNTVYNDPMDSDYKRIKYVRYADDFLISVLGSKDDAKKVKIDIGEFLSEKLKLTMSEEKTLITHGTEFAHFVSYDIAVCDKQSVSTDKNGNKARRHSGKVRLFMPREKWQKKLQDYNTFVVTHDKNNDNKEIWKPIH